MKQFTYKVTDELGIHARPAGLLVKEAAKFQSSIKIKNGTKEADAKRLLNVMTLAVKQGNTVTVAADGADEADAVKTLEAFFKANL
ncbi:MAG: HPr family phosphocarrier protein [Lachnospiraceae bacterium]|nr:HPr family phosphocarrier protein [Lachnospiraceae bacterium]